MSINASYSCYHPLVVRPWRLRTSWNLKIQMSITGVVFFCSETTGSFVHCIVADVVPLNIPVNINLFARDLIRRYANLICVGLHFSASTQQASNQCSFAWASIDEGTDIYHIIRKESACKNWAELIATAILFVIISTAYISVVSTTWHTRITYSSYY